jgi:hypothetical protein
MKDESDNKDSDSSFLLPHSSLPASAPAACPSPLAVLRDLLPLQEPSADLAALRHDVDAVFERLDHLARLDSDFPSTPRVLAWLVAGAAVLEIARRGVRRRARTAPPGDVVVDSVLSLPETA